MRSVISTAVLAAGLVAISAGAALAGTPPTANTSAAAATGNLTSSRWAGYYATSAGASTGAPIRSVFAEFTVPNVSCKSGWGSYPRTAAMWAGVGGEQDVDPGSYLEQAGVFIGCASAASRPAYVPFWQVAPPPGAVGGTSLETWGPKNNPDTVQSGDLIEIQVSAPGWSEANPKTWAFDVSLGNRSFQGWQHFFLPEAGRNPGDTAEVITEWTTEPNSWCVNLPNDHFCFKVPGLLDVGPIKYTQAEFATGSSPGSANATWQAVTWRTITMQRWDWAKLPPGNVKVMYPGQAGPYEAGSYNPDDNEFSTYYTGKW